METVTMTREEANKVHGLIADLITQLDWTEKELEEIKKHCRNAIYDIQGNRKRLSSLAIVKTVTSVLS